MSSANASLGQDRARSRGRGNRGKYLRARGRRGLGRAAEFAPRLLLEEDLGVEDLDNDEDDQDDLGKYAKREIVDNADKYAEPGVDINAEDSEEPEPEVDLSSFLDKQRLQGLVETSSGLQDDDIDHSLADLSLSTRPSKPRKNLVQQIEWDTSLEELKKEKEAADAVRDLKARFLKSQGSLQKPTRQGNKRRDQTTLAGWSPAGQVEEAGSKDKTEMEDFLDDLIS